MGAGSISRMSLPIYWRWRARAARARNCRASRIASSRGSGRSRACSCASRSSTSSSPNFCAASAARLRALLLGRSSGGSGMRALRVSRGLRLLQSFIMDAAVDESRIPELQEIVRLALGEARRRGAAECEVDASLNQGISVSVRLGEVDTVEYQRDRGLGITVYFDKKKGSASTADLAPAAVRAMVEKACSIARYTAADECAGLPDAENLARDIPDLDLDHPWSLAPDEAIGLALTCEAAGLAVDARLTNSEGASVTSQRDLRVHGNSLGFLAGFGSTSHSVSCVLLAEEGEDMERDYWYSTARDHADLEDIESIGRRAA